MTPLDRLGPRAVLGSLTAALRDGPATWPVLLIPIPWFWLNGTYFALRVGASPTRAVGASALALTVLLLVEVLLLWIVLPLVERWFAIRSAPVVMLAYAAGGVAKAAVLVVAVLPEKSRWADGVWLAVSSGVNSAIWMASAAILAGWWKRMRAQRLDLDAQYERQVLVRSEDARALERTGRQLDQVRENTHRALSLIGVRLRPNLTLAELDGCITAIDEVVARLIRPVSHDLARVEDTIDIQVDEPLWRSWRELVPALIRGWPRGRPFQPVLVGVLCLPMVIAAELVHPPHDFDAEAWVGVITLGLHVALLALARFTLAPMLRRTPARLGVAVVMTVYLVEYLLGLAAVGFALRRGLEVPLEAFLMPPLLAMVAGGISAVGTVRLMEDDAAKRLIRRTDWQVRHTKQQLWAQRRRLAMALHGRVQANLTAASLMLGLARQQLVGGGQLDPEVMERVRSTLALANLIEEAPPLLPAARIAAVTEVWAGVLAVHVDLRPQALTLLEADADLTDACVEVVRELLLNAVRHSGATRSEVVLGAESESLLCLRVTELGGERRPLGSAGGPGIGRSLMYSLAVDWAEADGASGRVTVAMLAAGTGQDGGCDARARLFDVASLR